MEFSQIKPYVRFVRRLEINSNSVFQKIFPLDARLFYVSEGEGKIEIDEKILTLPVGSVLYINSGCVYRLLTCNVVYIAVNFDFTFNFSHLDTPVQPVNINVYSGEKPFESIEFSDTTCFNRYCFFEDFHSLQINLLKLEKEYSGKMPYYKQETSYIFSSILTAIVRRAENRSYKDTRFNIEKVLEYIGKHYSEPLDNGTLGKIFHFHPNYISTEFKRSTGKSLHQFVLETRIFNAVSLMESGCDNINEIAAFTGFCDPNYFSRYFKQVMGVSPTKYIHRCIEK